MRVVYCSLPLLPNCVKSLQRPSVHIYLLLVLSIIILSSFTVMLEFPTFIPQSPISCLTECAIMCFQYCLASEPISVQLLSSIGGFVNTHVLIAVGQDIFAAWDIVSVSKISFHSVGMVCFSKTSCSGIFPSLPRQWRICCGGL